ncbi:BURP domain [Sesbania bispinosa]|nr:BURP domain [Sesbania bispinosa]
MHSKIQPFGARTWGEAKSRQVETHQPFGARTWGEAQPFGLRTWAEVKSSPLETHQPFGARTWGEVKSRTWGEVKSSLVETHQPFGARTWGEVKSSPVEVETHQPFGARTWGEVKSSPIETHQPFGARTWGEVKSSPVETHQPFGARTWGEVKSSPIETHQTFRARRLPNPGKTIEREETYTLDDYCGTSAAIGEDKYCASSLEAMMDYAISKLGKNIKVISSSFPQNQDYVVEEVNKIGDKAVMCHRMNYEKVVFYCHQVNATTSYMVPLVASDGTKAKALTICHHDTRGMDPIVLYQVLKVKPGTVPVCHFVGNKAVAWVPKQVGSEFEDHPCVI